MIRTVALRPLQASDAAGLSALLKSAPADYVRYFTPFSFEADALERLISSAQKDRLVGIEVQTGGDVELAGFYMLRGLDEGFSAPMYGVFIGYQHRNRRLAQLTLAHAEATCRLNDIKSLLLKVHPQNARAKTLYESVGFATVRTDSANNNLVMEKLLSEQNRK